MRHTPLWPDSVWFSMCQEHSDYAETCELCNAGIWRSRYRLFMDIYSYQTAVMSYTVTKHAAYQAIKAMGPAVIPQLFDDIYRRREGTWAAISLVYEILGRDNGPVIPEWQRGRYEAICKIFMKWWEEHEKEYVR